MAQYGLLGRKLGHSFSVPIHLSFGCPQYELMEVEPENLDKFMREKSFSAINVTIPYKQSVIPYCDHLSPEAAEIGSVNTVVNRGGELFGYNTDIYGFTYMLKSAGIDFAGKKVLILGSGGTSHTAQIAAKHMNAGEIVVISRSGENNYQNLDRHADADIIVNTTPVGMYPDCPAAPLSLKGFPKLSGVVDVIFNPARTGIIMEAEELGIPCVSGLKMLVAQAKEAEEHFFGNSLPDGQIEDIYQLLRAQTQNIVIIGMPGAGKTTVGKILSSISGREIADTDSEIVRRAGMSIPEIFAKYGEEHFRRIETEVLADFGKKSGLIISCGGGVVTRDENYPLLHQNGMIFEIERNINLLPTAGRPLSEGENALENMYRIRRPMYERFRDLSADNNGRVRDCAEKIWSDFCENTCD